MKRLLVLALVLSASVASAEPLRASPGWLRLYLPIRPQLSPGAGSGGSGGTASALTFLSPNTAQTPDTYYFSTDPLGNSLIIGEAADAGFDFAHPQQTDPALFIHSHNQSTTQWIGLWHDGTNGNLAIGTGNILFKISGSVAAGISGNGLDMALNFLAAGTSVGTNDTYMQRHSAGVWRTLSGGAAYTSLIGGGAAVASAGALPVPTGSLFHVTGTTNITSITATNFVSGVCITMIFDGILTVTDGGNLKLAGNFVTAADSTLGLCYDGTSWYEVRRSTN